MQARDNDCSAHRTAANSRGGKSAFPPRARGPIGTVGRLAGMLLALALASSPYAAVRAGTAPPTVYCVSNVAQLQAALAAIQSTQGSFDLRIRSGYYPLTAPASGSNYGLRLEKIFRPNDGQLGFNRISGTWNEGCQQRATVINASTSTLIDGQGQTGNLYVVTDSFTGGNQPEEIHDLVIERIQFANGNGGGGGDLRASVFPGDEVLQTRRDHRQDPGRTVRGHRAQFPGRRLGGGPQLDLPWQQRPDHPWHEHQRR